MEITTENVLLIGSFVLLISVFSSKAAVINRGVPVLFVFLVLGILFGSNGVVGIEFTDTKHIQFIGVLALIFILFSGGLDTNINDVKPIVGRGLVLSFFGVIITAVAVGTFIYYISEFSFIESMLIASIFSSTDAGAVFGVFRSRNLGVNKKLQSLLEFESGSNDPTAFLLTIVILDLIQKPVVEPLSIAILFLQSLILGIIFGFGFGKLAVILMNKISLSIDGLYFVLALSISILTYAVTDTVNGNGFLAVYIAALVMGNSDFVHKRSTFRFYDGVS